MTLDRGTVAFTLATTAVGLAVLAMAESLLFYGAAYWALLIGPGVAAVIALGVWWALRGVCTGAGKAAHASALLGIALLCGWAVFGISFGGTVAIPSALLLMVAHAIVPSPR